MVIEGLGELRAAMQSYAAAFDADVITIDQATLVVEEAARIKHIAATLEAVAGAKVAETSRWREEGHRSAADWLARKTGTTAGAARETLAMGEQLEALPETATRAKAGDLSAAQTAAIADAATADPSAEASLLEAAERESVGELRQRCGRTKAAADPTPDATHARLHAGRALRKFTDAEGFSRYDLRTTPENRGRIDSVLGPMIEKIFEQARDDGTRESYDAYAHDAFVALLLTGTGERPASKNPRFLGLLRVDIESLHRGWVLGEEVCEIQGVGTVPVRIARELLGESILNIVITKGVDVANVTHLRRGANSAQQIALWWSSPVCTVEGCGHMARLQNDHRDPYAEVRCTATTNLDPLCKFHHDLKTYDGWALIEGVGKRAMVAPDDERHPRRKQAAVA